MALERYRQKRNPERTPEPFGGVDSASEPTKKGGLFVIQKHAATRLHYDFRLAMEGVLRSWAIPKGPSLDPDDKRLAVMVEDHPIDYGDFEGVIPRGNYGAGEVIVWDRGVYRVIDPPDGDAAQCVRNGKLDIEMRGFKIRGAYTLVRTNLSDGKKHEQKNWLLIKKRDQWAASAKQAGEDLVSTHPRSILSGLTIEEMRDSAAIGKAIADKLAEEGGAKITGPLRLRDFPLNLAKPHETAFDGDNWLFELKYDGVRALAIRDGQHVQIFARSGTDVTQRYPEVALAFDALPFDRFVIDGEIVALTEEGRPSFSMLQHRMHISDPAAARRLSFSIPVVNFVFDLLAFDSYDLRSKPLEERKQILARLVRGEGPIRYCDHVIGRGREFFEAISARGLEGMVAKQRNSIYRGTRTAEWFKIKCPTVRNFVIGGFSNPEGARAHFGALLLGVYEADGRLRYVGRVGTGFSGDTLRAIEQKLQPLMRDSSPFRRAAPNERQMERGVHFVDPALVARVRFGELTDEGCVRHASFIALEKNPKPRECTWEAAFGSASGTSRAEVQSAMPRESAASDGAHGANAAGTSREVMITNPEKIFSQAEGYTKGDLVEYYRSIAKWMLPYLKDRPVMIVRYPNGIEGKSFYQKDAPEFAPEWIRTEKICADDSQREINHFVIESADALAYLANLGTIPIHIWSSRIGSLENPDWLLFDVDPKGSTTVNAVAVAREIIALLEEADLRATVKTSGQMGIHVMVGLRAIYTYQQARDFSEIVARLVVARLPELATIDRNKATRGGKVYIDYLQLGHGKTIAGPYAVRPIPGAPVSSPLKISELRTGLDPGKFTIRNMVPRMAQLKKDPFLGAIRDQQRLESAIKILAAKFGASGLA